MTALYQQIRDALQAPMSRSGVGGLELRVLPYDRLDGGVNFMLVKTMARGALVGRTFAHTGGAAPTADVAQAWVDRAVANIRRYDAQQDGGPPP